MNFPSLSIAALVSSLLLGGLPTPTNASTCVKNAPADAICIHQNNFDAGTFIIKESGTYKLCEDVEFKPSPYGFASGSPIDAFVPNFENYDENAYGMGFFAAIAIATSGVDLYLDCHEIKQSPEHALLQRFYAQIELASSPFLPATGPHDFGDNFVGAEDVSILGPGTLGRSSHHGIHGNENSNITIRDVTFEDFEVGAVSLNNVDDLVIEDCKITRNRHDVPVVGSWSGATFIRPYLDALQKMEYEMSIQGSTVTAAEAYTDLTNSLVAVYEDVMTYGFIDESKNPKEFALFDNIHRAIDGPCYAFVVHGKGPAVGGMGFTLDEDESITSSNIVIQSNEIENIKCWTNEIPAAVVNGAVQNDARGAVLQFVNAVDGLPIAIDSSGQYLPNVVANAQIMVAKAIQDGILINSPVLQTGVNTISPEIVEWASTDGATFSPTYRCNGDSMHHVSKGSIVIRVEDTEGFVIRDNVIAGIENLSPPPFSGPCIDFHLGASIENSNEQQGGNIRGIAVAAVTGFVKEKGGAPESSLIEGNTIIGAWSNNANVIVGIDIQGQSDDIDVDFNSVDLDGPEHGFFDNKYIAFRSRENVVSNNGRFAVTVGENNEFTQSIEVLNVNGGGSNRRLRALQEVHKGVPMPEGFQNEWAYGGCPFARGRNQSTGK